MKTMFRLVKKNMKLLLRSKSSALIVVMGPLLLILLAGLAFDNTQTYSVSLGTYSTSYNQLSNGFIADLEESEFQVTKYQSEEICVEAIREGAIHSCMVFSPEFKLGENMNNEITFYVDYSKVNLVYMVLDTISMKIGESSEELSLNLTTNLLDTIDHTRKEVTEKKSTIVTLTTKNDEIKDKVESTYKKLEGLDVSADEMTGAAVTNLTSKRDALSSHIDDLEGVAEDAIFASESIMYDIEFEIMSSSLTPEEKSSIIAMLNSSRSNLNTIEGTLASTSNLTTADMTGLNTAITSVEADINGAKQKLNNAASAKTESLENLNNAKSLIGDMLSNIAVVQNSMNSIESKIGAISVTEASNIVSPVSTTIKPVVAETTHLNYIFPVLVVLVLMFTGILLSTTLIMLEKKTTAYFRNFISPTKDLTFISSVFVTCFLILLLQVVVILGISAIYFGPQIFYSLGKSAPILLFCISLFTLSGMLVGYLFNSSETATLGAISIGSIMLLLSDVILPLESMPRYVLDIAQYNPFVLGSSLLRKAIIHNVPFTSIEGGVALLLGYCAAIFVLVIAVQSITKKHYVAKFLRNIAAKPDDKEKAKTNK